MFDDKIHKRSPRLGDLYPNDGYVHGFGQGFRRGFRRMTEVHSLIGLITSGTYLRIIIIIIIIIIINTVM